MQITTAAGIIKIQKSKETSVATLLSLLCVLDQCDSVSACEQNDNCLFECLCSLEWQMNDEHDKKKKPVKSTTATCKFYLAK